MTQNDEHFDEFQPHTRLKHQILDSYIVAWAMKLLQRPGSSGRLGIVDAFAGAGSDASGQLGSPLIILKRATEAARLVARTKTLRRPDIRIFAIEARAKYFDSLRGALGAHRGDYGVAVQAMRGELCDHIDEIAEQMGDDPTFYFLDPFGIRGLDATTYPKALTAPRNEMFVLFNNIGAVRLHGLVTAPHADAARTIEEIRSAPSLFPELDASRIAAAEHDAEVSNRALDASSPASRVHLARALGSEKWLDELKAVPSIARADAFLRLFREVLVDAGARYVLTVPMRNDEGQRVYALVHASKSPAGYVTMKECVTSGLRRDTLSADALERIVQDISVDLDDLVAQLGKSFAGQTVRWSGEPAAVRETVLHESSMFQIQANDLKERLKSIGILRKVDRKDTCVFPPAT